MTFEERTQRRAAAIAETLKHHFTNLSIATTLELAFKILAAERKVEEEV